VLELKEKLGAVTEPSLAAVGDGPSHLVARDALVELGYSVVDAERALADVDPELPAEERVRLALRGAAA
jgi:Holliday junction resolvasome RuvABC DNA-binding subunit